MLQVHDIRETRVYQEALNEGREQEKREILSKLAALNMPPAEIARILGLDVDLVIKEIAQKRS